MRSQSAPNETQRGTGGQQAARSAPAHLKTASVAGGDRSASEGANRTVACTCELLPDQRWFAVQCQANREHGAAMQLRNQGFHVFLPLRLKPWRHARQLRHRQVPFFPGYLFIAMDLARDRWRSINGTYGVQRLVMAGGEAHPVALPRGIIEALCREADERGCLRFQEPLRVGQGVRILAGPFGDRLAELIELDDAGRVRVLIELLGGRVPVALPRGEVTAAR